MKKLGVVLLTLGIIAVIVGLFPDLAMANPAPKFGPLQQIVVGIGLVVFLIGALMCLRGGKCCACAAPKTEPAEEPDEEEKIEPPSE